MDEFAASYLALNDKLYLEAIAMKIIQQARQERDKPVEMQNNWSKSRQLHGAEFCDDESFAALTKAESERCVLTVEANGTIAASLPGRGTFYLRSNSDIQHFGKYIGERGIAV